MNREAFVKEAGPTSPRIMMQKGKDGVCAARRQMIMAMSLTQDSRAYCANEMSVANENESEGTGLVNVGMSSETSKRIGVVVVDHGSKKERANEMLLSFADMFRDAFRSSQTLVDGVSGELEEKEVIVESAHMELATPSIEDAIRKLYFENEIQLIVVAPFFLAHGRHVTQDIPQLVREAQDKINSEINGGCTNQSQNLSSTPLYRPSGQLECIISEPIGLHPLVANIMKERVDECILLKENQKANLEPKS